MGVWALSWEVRNHKYTLQVHLKLDADFMSGPIWSPAGFFFFFVGAILVKFAKLLDANAMIARVKALLSW